MNIMSSMLYKTFVTGVIVLFIGIAITPSINANTENEISSGRGFIICFTRIRSPNMKLYLPATLSLVSCEDLNTGQIKLGVTRFFGIHVFKFLPTGHNYKLNAYPPDVWDGEKTIYDIGNVNIVIFSIDITLN